MTDTAPLLSASALSIGYRGRPLLPPVSFDVAPGELWGVIGPNGSGKSTLLRTLLGLKPALSGKVSASAVMGYVPQRSPYGVGLPGRVRDFVAGGADLGWSFARPGALRSKRDAIDRAIKRAHVEDIADQRLDQLSEGQRQRAAIARALAGESRLLVLDEPTSAMDVESEHRVMHLLDEIRASNEFAVLLVSHHVAVVAEFATHILVFDRDLGSVVAGPIEAAGRSPAVISRYGELFIDPQRHTASHFAAVGHPHDCS